MKRSGMILCTLILSALICSCGDGNNTVPAPTETTSAEETQESTAAEVSADETSITEEPTETAAGNDETEPQTQTTKTHETVSQAYPADTDSILGSWYFVSANEIGCYTFNSDGTASMQPWGDGSGNAEFTVSNGLVELTIPDADFFDSESWAAVCDGGKMYIAEMGINRDIIREEYFPIEAGQTVDEYFDLLDERYVMLTREKPVLANQQDILGTWVMTGNDDGEIREAVAIFDNDSTTVIEQHYHYTDPIVLKDGVWIAVGELPENVSLSDEETYFYLIDGKGYSTNSYGYIDPNNVMEKIEPREITAEVLEGAVNEDGYGHRYYFENGMLCASISFENGDDINTSCPCTVNGSKMTLALPAGETSFDCYLTEKYLYLASEEDDSVMTFIRN